MIIVSPVIQRAHYEARNSTGLSMSSGCPIRPSGVKAGLFFPRTVGKSSRAEASGDHHSRVHRVRANVSVTEHHYTRSVDEIVRQARAYLPLSFDPSLLTRDNLRSAAVAGDRAYAYSQTSYSLSDAPNFSRSEPNSQTQNESGSR
jgi:hypothetical protein